MIDKKSNNIRIITRHAVVNYGSVLQSFATEKFFQSLGYETEVIDYISDKETVRGRVKVFSNNYTKKPLKKWIYRIVKFPDEWIKERRFRRFRREMLHLTPRFRSLAELQAHDFGDDLLCAGSDQVWGYMSDGSVDPAYFLDFGGSGNRYFSYSASFGRDDFPGAYYDSITPLLKKFSFITVREKSGEDLLRAHASLPAVTILDPTLMLDRDTWLELADREIKPEPYILVYKLRKNKELDAYARALAKRKHCKILKISSSVYDFLGYGKKEILKDPRRVLSLFKNASAVVTDSFHATVFSIVFNRQFVDFLPPKTYKRITDFLQMLELENRIQRGEKDPMEKPIDWARINQFLANAREQATAYVKEQLKAMEEQK